MGFLSRKHKKSILVTKNPTGVPTVQKNKEEDGVPSASMIAAKAAAANMSRPMRPTQPQPIPSKITTVPVLTHPVTIRRRTSKVSQSPSQTSVTSSTRGGSTYHSPVLYHNVYHPDTSIENLSIHDDNNSPRHYQQSAQVASSIAAHTAMSKSTDFLQPPHHHRVYGSSASTSAMSSTNSLDSHNTHSKLNNSFSTDMFKVYGHPYNFSSDSELYMSGNDSETASAMSSKVNSAANLPYTTPGNDLSYSVSNSSHKLSMVSSIGTDDKKSIKPVPIRKAPPGTPPQEATLIGSSADASPVSYSQLQKKRSGSPRRKPPPDSIAENEDGRSGSASRLAVDEEEETIPRYPLAFDDDFNKKKRHGLRQGAKKILKKGLKSTTTHHHHSHLVPHTPSALLAEPEYKRPVQLRTTLRKERKQDKFNEDKPWKHHSDRWTITDQERKRYEGVWVTNKGSYMDMVDPSTLNNELDVPGALNTALKATMLPNESSGSDALGPQLSNLMLNVVAREIWQRSKLPNDLLRQVWDLVDTRHDGTLDRTSFIVGMWLVDQCLYGRKLPKVVNDEIWNSVSHIGVNVMLKGKK